MTNLTKERVEQAQIALRWLSGTHAKIIKAFRDSKQGPKFIADQIGVNQMLSGSLINGKAYLHDQGLEKGMRFAKFADVAGTYRQWQEHAKQVPSPRWWQLLLYPQAIDLACRTQLFVISLELKAQDWRSQEVIATAIDPERSVQVLQLLRFNREGFDIYESKEDAREFLIEALTNEDVIRQRLRRFERHLSALRRAVADAVRTLRVDEQGRSLTIDEIAKLIGYEPNTVRVAMVNSAVTTQNALKVYEKLCEKRRKPVELFWPKLPDAMVQEPADSAVETVPVGTFEADASPSDEPQTDSPAAQEAVDSAIAKPRADQPQAAVVRMSFKLALYRYLAAYLPPAWSSPGIIVQAIGNGRLPEQVFAERIEALQGSPVREAILDAMVHQLVERAQRERMPLPAVYPSVEVPQLSLLLQTANHLLDQLRTSRSLQEMDLGTSDTEQLLTVLSEIYEAIEIFTSGSPHEIAALINANRTVGQALQGRTKG